MRLSAILMLILIFINCSRAYADDDNEQSYQGISTEQDTLPGSSQNTQPLDLTVTPDIIHESEIQKKTEKQKNDPLLPDFFENQEKKDISISGALINNEADSSDVIDGAEISIKVNTK